MLFMEKFFNITFANRTAAVIPVQSLTELSASLQSIGLDLPSRPVLVIIGGASKLSEADYQQLRRLFLEGLAPVAQQWQACVVDGGTDAGVMKLMGEARTAIAGTFPLIGVTPIGLAALPGTIPQSDEATPLEPSHTHFVLVPGANWGDESAWIAAVASELAGNAPSVAILINGGEITWKDAFCNAEVGRSIVVVAGSGRTADQIAAGLRGEPADERASALIESGLVQAVHLNKGTEALASLLEKMFSAKKAVLEA